jgi:hypothetical protein
MKPLFMIYFFKEKRRLSFILWFILNSIKVRIGSSFSMFQRDVNSQGLSGFENLTAKITGLIETREMGFCVFLYASFVFMTAVAKFALPEFSKLIGSLNHRVGYQIVKL